MDIFSNPGTIWFIVGAILFLFEFIIPGVIILFFGVGAWITSVVTFTLEPSLIWQLITFCVTSTISLIFFRKPVINRIYKGSSDNDEKFIGHLAIVKEDIFPNKDGKVEFKGSTWIATSKEHIPSMNKVIIIDKVGISLVVMANR